MGRLNGVVRQPGRSFSLADRVALPTPAAWPLGHAHSHYSAPGRHVRIAENVAEPPSQAPRRQLPPPRPASTTSAQRIVGAGPARLDGDDGARWEEGSFSKRCGALTRRRRGLKVRRGCGARVTAEVGLPGWWHPRTVFEAQRWRASWENAPADLTAKPKGFSP